MRPAVLLTALLAPLTILAAPAPVDNAAMISGRQVVKPKPCEPMDPLPTEEETKARFDIFADAFIVKKNITAAFEFINKGYIVCYIAISSTPLRCLPTLLALLGEHY